MTLIWPAKTKKKGKLKGQKPTTKVKEELIMSLESQLDAGGEVYKEHASNNVVAPDGGSSGSDVVANKPKKKVIYFADGSTMEDDDEEEDPKSRNKGASSTDSIEGTIRSVKAHTSESEPPLDPTKMQWPEWVRHYGSKAGSKTLTVLEGMGGTAAYYLGITTPKYQSEIDEYNRMVAKKKSQEEELVSWSSGPKTQDQEPVVSDVRKNENNGDIEMTEK